VISVLDTCCVAVAVAEVQCSAIVVLLMLLVLVYGEFFEGERLQGRPFAMITSFD